MSSIIEKIDSLENTVRGLTKAVIDVNARIDAIENKGHDCSEVKNAIIGINKKIDEINKQLGLEPAKKEKKTPSELNCKRLTDYILSYCKLRGCDPMVVSALTVTISPKLNEFFDAYCKGNEEEYRDFTKVMDSIFTFDVASKSEIVEMIDAIAAWKTMEESCITYGKWVVDGKGDSYRVLRLADYDS